MKKVSLLLAFIFCGSQLFAAATESDIKKAANSSSLPSPRPTKISDEGDYYYGAEKSDEAIYYKIEHLPPIKGALFLRFGTVGPYDVTGDSGATFQQIYSDKSSFVLVVEYERYLGQLLGKWSFKLGTGLTTEEGNGRFVNDTINVPREKYTFFIMPNTALLNYKLKFSDTQLITPYVEAGGGYFTFIEYRSDGEKTNFGGAGVLAAGGGLMISMNILDKNAAGIMYEDYGVNHLWFDLQFRRYQGLDNQKDFSSNMVTGGFGFAF
jgi:hypothetical protein